MTYIHRLALPAGLTLLLAASAVAQYGSGTGTSTSGSTASGSAGAAPVNRFGGNYHLGFDRPEAWGLKYFASASMLSGLQPPRPAEGYRTGSLSLGLETGWLPALDEGQQRIGAKGRVPQDLNKAPVFARLVVRVGLPRKFVAVIAAPPPLRIFGVRSRLLAFGLERPLIERPAWTLGWRGYGQLGSVKGAFTCPRSVLAFEPGSPENPTKCVGESADIATLRYAGMEFQFARKLQRMPKLVPHAAVGGNWIDGVFLVHAPVKDGLDENRLWTRGGTFTASGGVGYLINNRVAFTVDAFYTPLWVQRTVNAPRTNDGLFNVRALLSYTLR